MSRRFTYEELDSYPSGRNNDFAVESAKMARDLFCNLWYLHPDQVVNNLSLIPPFLEATYDRVCGTVTPPLVPPAINLPGGQCTDVTYGISYSAANVTSNGFQGWGTPFTPPPATHRVGVVPPVRLGTIGNLLLPGYEHWSFQNSSSGVLLPSNMRRYYVIIDGIWIPLNQGWGCKLNGWVRVAGNADICGNPPPSYLPSNNVTVNETNITNTIVLEDNRQLEIPVSLVIRQDNRSLNIPVTVNVGGVFFDIDLAGVFVRNINNTNSFGGGDDGILGEDGEDSEDGGGGLGREPVPNNNSEDFEETDLPETDGEEVTDIERLGYVKVKLQTIPSNAKSFAGLGAPNVYKAGWLQFKAGSHNFPKEFIDFQASIFIAPIGADGFSYHLNMGYTGRVTIVQVRG